MFWGYSIIPFHTPCRPRRDSLVCTAEFRSSVTGLPVLLSNENKVAKVATDSQAALATVKKTRKGKCEELVAKISDRISRLGEEGKQLLFVWVGGGSLWVERKRVS